MNILIILLYLCKTVSLSKILATTIFPSYSHETLYQRLWIELAERGHEVTLITSHPINTSLTNLKQIDYSICKNMWKNRAAVKTVDVKTIISQDFVMFGKFAQIIFTMPEVQSLIKNSTFDLVISEWIYPAMFGFSAIFKCPLIGINSIEVLDPLSIDIGRLLHPVVHSSFLLPFKRATNFWERLKCVEYSLWMKYFFDFTVYPKSNEIVHQYLGPNLPSVQEIMKNVSLVFINTNFLFFRPRPGTPNVIEFSGLLMKPPKPLPEEIKFFLDESTNGVVYFSLGSNIKSHSIPIDLRNIITETFKQLPYKILWKFEDDNFTIPRNVKICKWLPQQDILAHKNVKVFITQGGLQSLEEAIRKRVPLVGLPFILDQTANVKTMVDLGIAKLVDKSSITVEKFKEAIIEVAENNKYQKNINILADLIEDEPVKGLDKIIWGIEHVLRNKGAQHFRSPYLDYPWYQYFLLDIVAFVITCVVIATLLITFLLNIILKITGKIKKKIE